mmetsp:Transcript_15090/g.24062  ORF Transcript_15090/g.24062 Transcript_15090/m.24062 type:complete len:267 (+) Transcript_15090:317-1117(+)
MEGLGAIIIMIIIIVVVGEGGVQSRCLGQTLWRGPKAALPSVFGRAFEGAYPVPSYGRRHLNLPAQCSRRKELIAAGSKVSLDVLLILACELYGRPDGVEGGFFALLPKKTPQEDKIRAIASLNAARNALNNGDLIYAEEKFGEVLANVPSNWKLCQEALSERDALRKRLNGGNGYNSSDAVKQWIWGRGTRWPFHYLIIYATLRPFIVQEASITAVKSSKDQQNSVDARRKQKGVKERVFFLEAGTLILIIALYNVILLRYGLDY